MATCKTFPRFCHPSNVIVAIIWLYQNIISGRQGGQMHHHALIPVHVTLKNEGLLILKKAWDVKQHQLRKKKTARKSLQQLTLLNCVFLCPKSLPSWYVFLHETYFRPTKKMKLHQLHHNGEGNNVQWNTWKRLLFPPSRHFDMSYSRKSIAVTSNINDASVSFKCQVATVRQPATIHSASPPKLKQLQRTQLLFWKKSFFTILFFLFYLLKTSPKNIHGKLLASRDLRHILKRVMPI